MFSLRTLCPHICGSEADSPFPRAPGAPPRMPPTADKPFFIFDGVADTVYSITTAVLLVSKCYKSTLITGTDICILILVAVKLALLLASLVNLHFIRSSETNIKTLHLKLGFVIVAVRAFFAALEFLAFGNLYDVEYLLGSIFFYMATLCIRVRNLMIVKEKMESAENTIDWNN